MNLSRLSACLLCSIVCSLVIACTPSPSTIQADRYTLGTLVQLELVAQAENAEKFFFDFDALSETQTQALYAWGSGELVAINQALSKGTCTHTLPAYMLELFKQAKHLNQTSQGLFEPGIMPLVELWGFHRSEDIRSSPPSNATIDSLLTQMGLIADVSISNARLCSKQNTQLDLGGIAKGWAAHTALQQLAKHRIEHALIGFGGDLVAIGSKEDGTQWKVGLKNPNLNAKDFDAPAVFHIPKEGVTAIYTSGDYERQFEHAGKRHHHILDPRTGYPNTAVRSVTVIHPDPILADAAATALHVAGSDWPRIAKAMQLTHVLVLFPNKHAQITTPLSAMTTWLDPEYQVETLDLRP